MKQTIRMALAAVIITSTILFFTGVAISGNAAKTDACTLLTQAEIQAVIGQKVGEGKLSATANPATGAPCQYMVGSSGLFSIAIKTAGPGETAGKVMEELKKRNIAVAKSSAGIGDRSFFSSPGYGMVQLNTFKDSNYLIITMLVPGKTEADQKKAAENLMRTALAKL